MKKIIAILTGILLICSSFLPMAFTAVAATTTTLTKLYDEDNYEVYGSGGASALSTISIGSDQIKTKSGQSKVMYKYATDMKDFSASMVMKSPSNGATLAGFAFHIDKDDFKTADAIGTKGYIILIDRLTDLSKADVIIRYYKTATSHKSETLATITGLPTDKDLKLRFDIDVKGNDVNYKVLSADGTKTYVESKASTKATLNKHGNDYYFEKGALAFISNGTHVFTKLSAVADGTFTVPAESTTPPTPSQNAEIVAKYNLSNLTSVTLESDNFSTTPDSYARGVLKTTATTPVKDFSADMKFKINDSGDLNAGIIFRTGAFGIGANDLEGYLLRLQKAPGDSGNQARIVLRLQRYGTVNGEYKDLGEVARIENTTVLGYYGEYKEKSKDQIINLHINVVGDRVQAYFEGNTNPNDATAVRRSQLLDATLPTDGYYAEGGVGFQISKANYVNAKDFTVKVAEDLITDGQTPGGVAGDPAEDIKRGSAVSGKGATINSTKPVNISAPSVDKLADYAADFDNYTIYSSVTDSKFTREDSGITVGKRADNTIGTHRAMLDGVTVKGFHAVATMKLSSEGTLSSGIIFRANNIKNGVNTKNGTLGGSDIEAYTVVLKKTSGTTDNQARIVMLVYKYGIRNGEYNFLGTVASKANTTVLAGCENNSAQAAGKVIAMDINVIDDTLTGYFYDANDPTNKSEKLVCDLTDETDVEGTSPSLKGVNYTSGAIGLTTTSMITITNFSVGEPIYPSKYVGPLDDLDSYTIYGSGVTKQGDYFVANSSGTKKMIVNKLTVKDFKASVDMTIDENGNLKAGFFFRVNEVGNASDAQTGHAIIVSRNFSTNGENNPNRIDIVVFKWGYKNGKLTYLGEVAREAFKSGATFMDGKMAGEELTFVVEVKGPALDATLYHKKDKTNKPATFSSNLKFAAKNEKGDIQYFESGSIGLYLGNSTSDPLNNTKLRNFHIDDGSGVLVTKNSAWNKVTSSLGLSPLTGEGILILVIGAVFVISAGMLVTISIYIKKGKREKSGENIQ